MNNLRSAMGMTTPSRSYRLVWLLLALVAVLAAACAPAVTPTPKAAVQAPQSAATTAPNTRKEPIVFTYPGGDWGYPSPFARYSRGPGYIRMYFLFDTLTWKDKDGVIPWLAERWEMTDDGKTWTFFLRKDVRWHDGEPFTAEDVAFTFQYAIEKKAEINWSGEIAKVKAAEVADVHTVRLTLSEPMAGPHFDLFGSVPIIPKHIWDNVEDPTKYLDPEAVIGTGPFKLVRYSKEEGLYIYERNEDFWGGQVKVDSLVLPLVQDPAAALQAGEVDLTSFWGKAIDAAKQFEADPAYEIIPGPSFWVLQLIYNLERPPFDRAEVRQAIAHAIDRQNLVDQVTHGGAIVANLGIISPNTKWANPDLPAYEHDPAKAKAILENAGLGDLKLTIIQSGYDREAELIKANLEAAGISVVVKAGDRTTVDGLLREGDFDLAINGHGGIANPTTLRNPTWPATIYHNDAYAALYAAQARELDETKRRETIHKLQAILAEELPVLPLYHPLMWVVYRADSRVVPFYTAEGIAGGIPIELNKLMFVER